MKILFPKIKKIILITCFSFLLISSQVKAENSGDSLHFNIDSSYDISGRTDLDATLIKITPNLYFYIEKNWWVSQPSAKQSEVLNNLEILSQEFDNKIYPNLTSIFGSEWKPGVDGDNRITVLLHLMKDSSGGYFRSTDEYIKLQAPDSNEREMVYLSISKADNLNQLKVLLAHEFTHLIAFNQKEKKYNIQEETWLNESRAEYSATILGYNSNYAGSILQERVKGFLDNPSDSLTEWQNTKYDYGVINLFTNYLIDHYGINALIDSLQSKSTGIISIEEALQKNGFQDDFSQIFTNWTIAVLVNNCSLGQNYCYLNENLKDIRLLPTLNFLPLSGKSSLSVTNITKNWTGSWQKIFGGSGDLKLEFSSLKGLDFKVPYIIQGKDGSISLSFLSINKEQSGDILIKDFGTKNSSITIMPSLQTKKSGFDGIGPTYPFTFTVSTSGQQIIPNENPLIPMGFTFNKNLYYGMKNQDVIYLKILLAAEGCVSGLADTNYFGSQTLAGVKCFQNKYKSAISAAAGYTIKATGFVGVGTRTQLNLLLKKITP